MSKLVTYQHSAGPRVGRWDDREQLIRDLFYADGAPVIDLIAFLRSGLALDRLTTAAAPIDARTVKLLAPIPHPPRNVLCVGKNYARHANEFTSSGFDAGHANPAEAIPEVPIVFTKPPETVIATGDRVRYPEGVSDALDYEAELAVVIGIGGRGISRARALDHVFGYTIVNDVTARDWQRRHAQWFLGKGFDTFCPMGPCIATADEIDPSALELRCWINDELRQSATTHDLIFDVPTLIETISAGITLIPGDVIATGTPEGVGIGFQPPRFLKRGDRMRIQIDGIGTLENEVA